MCGSGSTCWAWIGYYLPVVVKGLACTKISNDSSKKGKAEEDVETAEEFLVLTLPDGFGEGAEEH